MQDTELYRHVLGLERPWKVDRVELDIGGGRVDVWAVHEKGLRWACPECRTELAIYDHAPERIWRHLDTCQFKTFLHARAVRRFIRRRPRSQPVFSFGTFSFEYSHRYFVPFSLSSSFCTSSRCSAFRTSSTAFPIWVIR